MKSQLKKSQLTRGSRERALIAALQRAQASLAQYRSFLADDLQIWEMQKGADYLLGMKVYARYELLKKRALVITELVEAIRDNS